jgi:succinate dehydrogenase/fumarate reductase cytochrome b subunit
MALTGLFLISFLIVHLSGNLQLLANDGGKSFNVYARFMSENTIIRIISIGLYTFIILHAIQGIILALRNRKAKGMKYKKGEPAGLNWAAKNMAVFGILMIAVATIAVVAYSRARTEPGCDGAGERLAPVWDDDVRKRVRGALEATQAPFAGDVADSVEEALDRHADEWTQAHVVACEQRRADEGDESEHRARTRCLDESLRLIASTYEEPQQVIDLYRNDPQLMAGLQNRVMEEQVIDWIAERAQHTEQALSFSEAIRQ